MDLTMDFGKKLHVRDTEDYDDDEEEDEEQDDTGSGDIAIEEDTEEEPTSPTTETPERGELKKSQDEQKQETKETNLAQQLNQPASDIPDVNKTSKEITAGNAKGCNTFNSVSIIVLLSINLFFGYCRFC